MAMFDDARRGALRALVAAPVAGTASALLAGRPQGQAAAPAQRLVSVLDFIPPPLHPAIAVGRAQEDLSEYFQAAAVAANAGARAGPGSSGTVFVPNGVYPVTQVGLRDTIFHGQSRDGAIIRAAAPGKADQFLFDAMLDRDRRSANTSGNGWVENLTIDAAGTGRSCLRTYGGGVHASSLVLKGGAYGLSAGLPMWSTFDSIYALGNEVGFHSFSAPRDGGTSTSFRSCWADRSRRYGFHITQLHYSSFINCAAQDSGIANFFVQGDSKGVEICRGLQFIGCGSEGTGTPFHFRRCRDLSVVGPLVVSAKRGLDYIVMDDSSGAIREFTAAPEGGGYAIGVRNHGGGDGAILVEASTFSFDPDLAQLFTIVGGLANGVSGMQAERFVWRFQRTQVEASMSVAAGVPTLAFGKGERRSLAVTDSGNAVLGAAPMANPGAALHPNEVSVEVAPDGSGLLFRYKDAQGRLRTSRLPAGR